MPVQNITLTEEWTLIAPDTGAYIVKNLSGEQVVIATTAENITPSDMNGTVLGGINSSMILSDRYIWARSFPGVTTAYVRIYPANEVDPDEDISAVSAAVNQLMAMATAHYANKNDPHETTKEQVGLGNIPNAVSDDPETNNPSVLASTVATQLIVDIINAHVSAVGNVHDLKKADIGLGNVADYPPATAEQALDITRNDLLLTPYSGNLLIGHIVEVSSNMKAGLVLEAYMGGRPVGWTSKDCSLPTMYLTLNSASTVKIAGGLKMTYGLDGKVFPTSVLGTDQILEITDLSDGWKYIHADLNPKGGWTTFGFTTGKPKYDQYQDSYQHDFFSVPSLTMYNSAGQKLRRVYIGRVYVQNGALFKAVNMPIGNRVIYPIQQTLGLGGRMIFDNPFMCDVHTVAEVEYNTNWGPTSWNDQIGVAATPNPKDVDDQIVVQAGLMGFLSDGRSSGSPFGASFNSIGVEPRIRVRCDRNLF